MSNMNQNDVGNKNEAEMVDMAERPSTSTHSISSHQSNDQMVEEVIIDIEAMLLNVEEPPSSASCCIYRVPQVIRELNEDAYTPKVVSIGPFHYGNPKLENMERYKQMIFKRFKERAQISLRDLVYLVKNLEPKVRACYSENIKLNKKEFVKVILVDAIFIIDQLLPDFTEGDLVDDAILPKPWLVDIITIDLILLENQLPFFVLEELFNKAFPLHLRRNPSSFLELTFDLFSYYNKQKLEAKHVSIKHFTDLLRTFHLQSFGRWKLDRKSFEVAESHFLLYSANELHDAGVKLKANTSKCLLDLKFSGDVLEIPQILVEDTTETIFRNMIALEQCHYPYESYFTDYVLIFDCLINTSKDVDILVHKQIIRSYLADNNNVAELFNGLWKNIVQENFSPDYLDICKELNSFYEDPWKNEKATLKRDYCKTPWQTAASIAGIVLIILTLVQTISSIIQVVVDFKRV